MELPLLQRTSLSLKQTFNTRIMYHSHNDRHPTKLTVSKSLLPSKTGSLEGRKSEQLCSSRLLLDSDEKTREVCADDQ